MAQQCLLDFSVSQQQRFQSSKIQLLRYQDLVIEMYVEYMAFEGISSLCVLSLHILLSLDASRCSYYFASYD